ncbi:hypothetical protein Scep_026715 [Stephania cephalantha]|uniref:Uncharacterized protein n=1 Tax=Stephania cephalantha TaxID=152367 RepID=A0AAP0EKR4_9MAGN
MDGNKISCALSAAMIMAAVVLLLARVGAAEVSLEVGGASVSDQECPQFCAKTCTEVKGDVDCVPTCVKNCKDEHSKPLVDVSIGGKDAASVSDQECPQFCAKTCKEVKGGVDCVPTCVTNCKDEHSKPLVDASEGAD